MKRCSKCGEVKPLEEFPLHNKKPDGRQSYCRVCKREYDKARRHTPHVEAVQRNGHLRRKFGITLEDYSHMLAQQGGRCLICQRPESDSSHGRFHVDHDHATGVVRGLLCDRCNRGIGYLQDDPALLRAAAEYLTNNRKEN